MGLGSILSGVGGLLGAGAGIANMFTGEKGQSTKKAKHHQLDYDRRRIKAIVDGANDAGIHPLAALGAAGSGGFAAPVTSGGGYGLGDAIGAGADALSAFGQLYQSDQDRLEEAAARKDEMAQRQREFAISNLRSKEITPETRLNREYMQLQNEALRQDILFKATSRSKLAATRAGSSGGPRSFTIGPDNFSLSPGSSSAQDAQDVGGELFEGLSSLDTLLYNLKNMHFKDFWKRSKEDIHRRNQMFKKKWSGTSQPDYDNPVY